MSLALMPPPRDQVGQPEWRAALFAEAIRHTAHVAGPINPFPLMSHLLTWLGIAEEKAGDEITLIIFLMVRSGLYTANTHSSATGKLYLGCDTRLTASPILSSMLYAVYENAEE
ncbi:hypothetical protein Q8W71_17555 [Methylobacterium sp. NEAU 140]|uniref:hypothetical protein n=1 Tax=Methylobacterium sp. NEAU 140 TaxID=3064945 RepID=UPI002735EBA3|nr:hypothetical protein [Methylobacterium sp. NEAU 140]MDP4024434.1 hypothetical protein [Methylobacterium sp. NEAU 140]